MSVEPRFGSLEPGQSISVEVFYDCSTNRDLDGHLLIETFVNVETRVDRAEVDLKIVRDLTPLRWSGTWSRTGSCRGDTAEFGGTIAIEIERFVVGRANQEGRLVQMSGLPDHFNDCAPTDAVTPQLMGFDLLVEEETHIRGRVSINTGLDLPPGFGVLFYTGEFDKEFRTFNGVQSTLDPDRGRLTLTRE